ncbi:MULTISPECIES: hypothetical protein [unclassified Exiguobacterium]|uniref:hypothetical protein n=1 Tax=unclassified Exiguobacterium TaxID=2644629 RepID=UPI000FE1BA8B|nr:MULTISPECIES: hypothetical protein [unclassified Exiguobacterium]RHB48625.1 hypothetical protein DW881_11045 [Exiguobacterium sp. AM39-5BH]
MKKTVLINASFLVEVEETEVHKDFGMIDQVTNELCQGQTIKLGTNEVDVEWESCSTVVLDSASMNCGQCSTCGRWTTDIEKSNPVLQLCNGATFEGKLLCDECLPENHRWSF